MSIIIIIASILRIGNGLKSINASGGGFYNGILNSKQEDYRHVSLPTSYIL